MLKQLQSLVPVSDRRAAEWRKQRGAVVKAAGLVACGIVYGPRCRLWSSGEGAAIEKGLKFWEGESNAADDKEETGGGD